MINAVITVNKSATITKGMMERDDWALDVTKWNG